MPNRSSRIILLGLTLLTFSLSPLSWALTNSEPALDPIFNAQVTIQTQAWDADSRQSISGFCNATFLSDRLLVTAAHCVMEAQLLGSNEVKVQAGEYRYVRRPDGEIRRTGLAPSEPKAVSVRFHLRSSLKKRMRQLGLRTQISSNEDIALIELLKPWQSPLPMQFPKLLPPTKDYLLDGNLNQRSQAVTINIFEETSSDTRRAAILEEVDFERGSFVSRSRARVQPMDSGGALYLIDGEERYLVGVVRGRAHTLLNDWDVYTSAVEFLREIEPIINSHSSKE